jgi:hypothetical protein
MVRWLWRWNAVGLSWNCCPETELWVRTRGIPVQKQTQDFTIPSVPLFRHNTTQHNTAHNVSEFVSPQITTICTCKPSAHTRYAHFISVGSNDEAVQRQKSYNSSALDGGDWSASRSGRCTPGTEHPVPAVLDTGCAPAPVRTIRKIGN